MPQDLSNPWMRVKGYVGLGDATIRAAIRNGELTIYRKNERSAILIRRSDIENWFRRAYPAVPAIADPAVRQF